MAAPPRSGAAIGRIKCNVQEFQLFDQDKEPPVEIDNTCQVFLRQTRVRNIDLYQGKVVNTDFNTPDETPAQECEEYVDGRNGDFRLRKGAVGMNRSIHATWDLGAFRNSFLPPPADCRP